jgi:hypothetical protein
MEFQMKKILLTLGLLPMVLFPMLGCPTATANTPPAALAPGYINQFDQTAGQSLAAAHALVAKAVADYPTLSPTQQAAEKPVLNAFVAALTQVSTAQTNYTSSEIK